MKKIVLGLVAITGFTFASETSILANAGQINGTGDAGIKIEREILKNIFVNDKLEITAGATKEKQGIASLKYTANSIEANIFMENEIGFERFLEEGKHDTQVFYKAGLGTDLSFFEYGKKISAGYNIGTEKQSLYIKYETLPIIDNLVMILDLQKDLSDNNNTATVGLKYNF